jgi:hypothetical protein
MGLSWLDWCLILLPLQGGEGSAKGTQSNLIITSTLCSQVRYTKRDRCAWDEICTVYSDAYSYVSIRVCRTGVVRVLMRMLGRRTLRSLPPSSSVLGLGRCCSVDTQRVFLECYLWMMRFRSVFGMGLSLFEASRTLEILLYIIRMF